MRFRAGINKDKLGMLMSQCKLIGELAKTAMVQLSPGVFEVAVRLEEDALQVFSKLTTEGVFTAFDVKSANHDRIGLEVKMASLIHAIKSCQDAPSVQMKLTKKAGIPYLALTALVSDGWAVGRGHPAHSHTRRAQNLDGTPATIQEVPVRVLPSAEVALYGEPDVPLLPVRDLRPRPQRHPPRHLDQPPFSRFHRDGAGSITLSFWPPHVCRAGSHEGAQQDGDAGGAASVGRGATRHAAHGPKACPCPSSISLPPPFRLPLPPFRQVVASVRSETLAVHTFFRDLISPAPMLPHTHEGGVVGAGELMAATPLSLLHLTPISPSRQATWLVKSPSASR